MAKFKVAHVINSMGLGGVPAVVYQLLKSLPSDDYEIYLYALKRYTDHSEVRENLAERFRQLGVRLFFPDRDEKKFHVVGDLCRWLIRDRIDLLHTHSYKPNIYGRLAGLLCREHGLKMIAHYHNDYDNKWEADGSLIYDQLLAGATDRLIACSKSVRRHVSERAGIPLEKIDVIPNGVDLDRFAVQHEPDRVKAELGIPLGRKVAAMIGRISEQKGQEDFIRAAKIIKETLPETVFLIVGSADEEALLSRLRRLVRELGVEKETFFIDYVPDIPKVYFIADVLVVPSRWEGFGLVLVEGMAAGKPIVATEVGAISELVARNETARLAPPGEPSAIAAEVVSLLRDPVRAKEMGEKGRARARQFSWRRSGEEMNALYRGIREGGPR